MWLALYAVLALAGAPERAEKLAGDALAAYDAGDGMKAWRKAEKALAKDPANPRALLVRGLMLLVAAEVFEGDDRDGAIDAARADLRRSADLAPGSQDSIRALATLSSLDPAPLVPEPEVACPAAGQAAMNRAEERFSGGDYAGAAEQYAKAVDACPANPTWRTWYGDAYFALGDYDRAEVEFRAALALQPCYWVAHRFLSDVHLRRGDLDAAHAAAVTAVACNPTYEIGWSWLENMTVSAGGRFARPRWAPSEGGASGRARTTFEAARVRPAEGTDLERTRDAVREALAAHGDALRAAADAEVWRALADADAAGRLEEAVLVLLLDASLVDDLRVASPDALAAYVAAHLAPLR